MKKIIYIFYLIILTITVTYAQSGSLDNSFSFDGKVSTAIGIADDRGYSVAIQTDGKIVVAGLSSNGLNDDFALVRYNTDGSLDMTFDSDGKVTTDFGNSIDYIQSVAIQTDGKIVAAGTAFNPTPGENTFSNFALARYNTNGSLDTTFDANGKVITDFGHSTDACYSVAIQSDGKIVACGYTNIGSNTTNISCKFAIVRYNSNGSIDTSFSSDGKVTTLNGNPCSEAFSVAIQSDGKIVVTGSTSNGTIAQGLALTRYNTDGSLDTSFHSNGKATLYILNYDVTGLSLALQDNGKIVVAGYTSNVDGSTEWDFMVARYNNNGNLDSTFDSDGIVITEIGNANDYVTSIAIQNDGKIVVAGNSVNSDYSQSNFAVVRYNSNGSLDSTLASGGKIITPNGTDSVFRLDQSPAVALQNDGKIVVAGFTYNGSDFDFAVVRYNVLTVDINEIKSDSLSVYPNPFSNELVIKGTTAKGEFILFDVSGQEILRKKTSDVQSIINTEFLRSGFYFLNYQEQNKTVNVKLIKP